MRHGKFILVLGLALLPVFLQGGAARADDFTDCLREVARADLNAKINYQRDLRDFIVERHPNFTELADINLDIQVLFADMRFARVEYLLATAPERLDIENGLSRFRNFNWTDDDLSRLKLASASYRDQLARLEALKSRNQGHPDWPGMRAFVKGEMSEGGALAYFTTDFIDHSAAMEARLAACQEN